MLRLLVGITIGWVAARWYYLSEPRPRAEMAESRPGSFGRRARRTLDEAGQVAKELGKEAEAGAQIEKNNLQDKAQRIKKTATG